jgi:hypothetical protein
MRRLIILVLALVVTPAASAATLTIAITTGNPITATGITLNGVDQTTTFTMAASVAYTGGGNTAGWNVTAAMTTLTSGTKTLPGLIVTTVSRGNCSGGGCVNPTNSITWPTVPLTTTAVKIYNAAANTGKGTVVLTGTYQVTYPANALPGTYSTVVTLSAVSGP